VHSGESNVDFKSNEVNLAPCRTHYWLVCQLAMIGALAPQHPSYVDFKPNNEVILCLVTFTTGLYAFVFAKIGAFASLSISSDLTTLNMPSAIAVAPAI
jgi:hypothetical protein